MKNLSRPGRALVVVSFGGALSFGFVALQASRLPWSLGSELELLRSSGWLACGALLLSLVVTPIAQARRFWAMRFGKEQGVSLATWIAYRRAFGIVAAGLALVHASLALGTYLFSSWRAVIENPHLRSGLVALLILVALLLTSFPSWVAAAGMRGWKELHRLAYVAALLVFHHLMLAPFASRTLTLTLFGSAFLVASLRLLPWLRTGRGTGRAGPGSE